MSRIEWTDATWNPATGCTRVSPGCEHCYAERMARRLDGRGVGYDGTTTSTPKGPRWSGQINLHPERLQEPLRWRRPRMAFVDSMSDLFHEDVPFEFIAAVYGVMAAAGDHTFQVLTKRPEQAVKFYAWMASEHTGGALTPQRKMTLAMHDAMGGRAPGGALTDNAVWPLPNVWLGTSVEDQRRADERIPHLLAAPAAVRFLSCEPLLGLVDLRLDDCWIPEDHYDLGDRLHWVIVGGESGPGARPMDLAWARSIVRQCDDAGVAVFVKQLGARPCRTYFNADIGDEFALTDPPPPPVAAHEAAVSVEFKPNDPKGGDPDEWPEDLRAREFPA